MVDLILRREKEFDEIVRLVRLIIPSADIIHNGDELTIRTDVNIAPIDLGRIKLDLGNSKIIRGEFK